MISFFSRDALLRGARISHAYACYCALAQWAFLPPANVDIHADY